MLCGNGIQRVGIRIRESETGDAVQPSGDRAVVDELGFCEEDDANEGVREAFVEGEARHGDGCAEIEMRAGRCGSLDDDGGLKLTSLRLADS